MNERADNRTISRLATVGRFGRNRYSNGHINFAVDRESGNEAFREGTESAGISRSPKIFGHSKGHGRPLSGVVPMIKDFFKTFSKLQEQSRQKKAEQSRAQKLINEARQEEAEVVERINAIVIDINRKKNNG
jgi:hypothetical protein